MDSRQWKGVVALACAAFVAAGTAAAEAPHGAAAHLDRQTVAVRVDDLNLSSDAGAHAMYSRLREATRRVCGTPERDLRRAAAVRDCRARALADAVTSANVPRLTALHAARTAPRQRYAASTRVAATR
jgi:UrcA family protein